MAVPIRVGIAVVVLPTVVGGGDLFHDACEIRVATWFELDGCHGTRGVRDEHGAQPVAHAGVGDDLLRMPGHVDGFGIAVGIERQILALYLHAHLCPVESARIAVYEATTGPSTSRVLAEGRPMSGHVADVDLGADVAVSDPMLVPLIEVAAEVLKELDVGDVPSSLRPLHGFDRRGLLAGPAPRQLRRALLTDGPFRERVVERFVARPEVGVVLSVWRLDNAAPMAAAALDCGDLALYVSALWAARPDGYAFGLGIAVVLDAQQRDRQRETDAGASAAQERAALAEACRRAEAARIESDTVLARAEEELIKERSARRTREDEAIGAAGAAHAQVETLRTELDQARAEVAEQQRRVARASQRAHTLEDDLRRTRADSRVLQARAEQAESRLGPRDERALNDAGTVARQLSVSLDALQRRIRDAGPGEEPPDDFPPRGRNRVREPAPTRRTPPRLPPGVVANSPAGVEAMLATPEVVLIVDGYNVAHRAWPDSTAGDQRERLGIAATALCRRLGCEVVLVFDGNGSRPRPALRRGGVRVLFSDAGEEADEVVVREVEARPRRIPVVVASSDAWVTEHARDQGAAVVGADALVRAIRPNR